MCLCEWSCLLSKVCKVPTKHHFQQESKSQPFSAGGCKQSTKYATLWRSLEFCPCLLIINNTGYLWGKKESENSYIKLTSVPKEKYTSTCCPARRVHLGIYVATTWYATASSSGWWSGCTTPMPRWMTSFAAVHPCTRGRNSMTCCHTPLTASQQVPWSLCVFVMFPCRSLIS